jgi:hypothetical protein
MDIHCFGLSKTKQFFNIFFMMVSHTVIKHAIYSIVSFQKFGGSDSDDTDEEGNDDTEEREKFVVFFGGASSEGTKERFWGAAIASLNSLPPAVTFVFFVDMHELNFVGLQVTAFAVSGASHRSTCPPHANTSMTRDKL